MFNKSKKSDKENVEEKAVESSESLKVESELQKSAQDASTSSAYEFEFKFVDGMKEVEKKNFTGEGKNESEAMIDARKKADAESNGKFTVIFSGNFKKIE